MTPLAAETAEWARADQVEAAFGLRPSYLRKLGDSGEVTMKVLRMPRRFGTSPRSPKGVRLYRVADIRQLIEAQ